jgi:ADP-ribose pyrophosphatase YjhB (NUDIX family)
MRGTEVGGMTDSTTPPHSARNEAETVLGPLGVVGAQKRHTRVNRSQRSVTNVVVLLLRDDGRVLTVRHSDASPTAPGQFTVIGGKREGGEFLDEGALRELREGAGVRVAREDLLFCQLADYRGPDDEWVIGAVFTAQRWQGEPCNAEPDKHTHLAWIDPGRPPSDCHPYTVAVLRRFVAGELYGAITASTSGGAV